MYYGSCSVQRSGVYISTTGPAVADVQYGLYKFDWNAHMKMVNGNKNSTITLGHWNGGSSHLGKSDKGLHKLEQIKFILKEYNVDILGISEANLHHDLDLCHYRIDGYDCIKSREKIARAITYVRSTLNYKVNFDLMNDYSAENWLEIGTHRNKWYMG